MLHTLLRFDATLRDWIAGDGQAWWLDHVMLGASIVGRGAAVWFGLALLAAITRRSRIPAAFRAGLAILLTMLTVDLVVKPWIHRERPSTTAAHVRMIDARSETYSFPSGHAANAAAGALALSRAWPPFGRMFWALAALVSVSRIFVGAHYPLDVLAGALLGLAWAGVVTGGTRVNGRQAGTTDS